MGRRGANGCSGALRRRRRFPGGFHKGGTRCSGGLRGVGSRTPPRAPYLEKRAFSCCDEADFASALAALGRKQVIVGGIEGHVCVLHTAIDLIAGGYTPLVVADCVSSRRSLDKEIALKRLQAEGALLTTCKSILFELTRTSPTQCFKATPRLVK